MRQLSKNIEAKMKKYNKLRSQVDDLQYEIENYLEERFRISTLNETDTYGESGNCPMYEWGTKYFDIQQIKDIITFKQKYYEKVGEEPDSDEISRHFA